MAEEISGPEPGPASGGSEEALAPPLGLETLEAAGMSQQAIEALEQRLADAQRELVERDQELKRAQAELVEAQTSLGEAQRAGLAQLRRALLAEHAGQLVPELVAGSSTEELEASLALARAAYERAAEAARQELASQQVPAGNVARQGADLEALSPLGKIAHGLQR